MSDDKQPHLLERSVPCDQPGLWVRQRYHLESGGRERVVSTTVYAQYYDQEGRRHREKVGPDCPKVRKLAERIHLGRKAAISEGRFFQHTPPPTLTLAQAAEVFWERHMRFRSGVSHKYVKAKIVAALGRQRLTAISTGALLDFLNGVFIATGPSNFNRYRAFLSSMFFRLREWDLYQGENPVSKIAKKREPNYRTTYLEFDEMVRLLSACSARIYPVVICAICTGLRRSEILGLTWDRVDMERGIITILKSKDGKRREGVMAPTLQRLLEGLGPRPEGSVFKLSKDELWPDWKAARAAAGLPEFEFRDLRHTCASHATMAGVDLYTVQKLLGHSKYEMTQRYAHLNDRHMAAGVQMLDARLHPALEKVERNRAGAGVRATQAELPSLRG